MGRAYTVSIPSGGVGVDPIPISVSGATYFTSIADFQIAYDPADFASDQFAELKPGQSNVPIMAFAPNTILWIRQDPAMGAPTATLSVLTQIGSGGY